MDGILPDDVLFDPFRTHDHCMREAARRSVDYLTPKDFLYGPKLRVMHVLQIMGIVDCRECA
jgi:hypothetical protein